MLHTGIFVADTELKGRGVFTRENIAAATIVEVSPVLVFDPAQRELLEKTDLYNYIFEWQEDNLSCCIGLGLISIYNHKLPSNCEYLMDFESNIMAIKTIRDIAANEELTINYSGDWDDATPVWFDTAPEEL